MRNKLLLFLGSFFLLSFFFGLLSLPKTFASYSWQELNVNGAAGVPAQRSSNTSSAWDSDNNRWLIFGGNNAAASAYFNDLWQYSSSGGWQQLTAQGDPTAPAARTNMAVAWDTQAHRLLMFGGFYNYGTTLNDLWQYTDANGWQQLTAQNDPNSPGTRDDTTAVWDSTNNRLLVFGGLAYIGDYHLYNDLWQYTTAGGWQQLTPDANPNAPTGRISHGSAWDTQNNRMLVFGGDTNSGGVRGSNDLWEYSDANGWQLLTAEDAAGSPPVRERGTVTWDSTNNRLLAFGGRLSNTPYLFNDLWQYTATGGWSQLTANGDSASPQQRGDQTMAWDTQNHRVLIFAGYNGVGELNDLWAYQNLVIPSTNVGNPTQGDQVDSSDANIANGSKFVVGPVGGNVQSMSVYVGNIDSSPNNKYQMAIYTNKTNGKPGTLVASTSVGNLTANSWNTLPISATFSANTTYWLMYDTNASVSTLNNMYYTNDEQNTGVYTTRTFGSFAPTYATSPTMTTQKFSLYATYVPDSALPTVLAGDNTVEANQDSNTAGRAEAFQFTAANSGSATNLSVFLSGANVATNVRVGVYSDNNNAPGTLLAHGTIASPVKFAWNNATISSTALTAGTKYWIAVMSPVGAGKVYFKDKATGGVGSVSSSQANLTTLPTTWTTGSSWATTSLSAYAY